MGKAIWEELRGWNRWIRSANASKEKGRLSEDQLGKASWGVGRPTVWKKRGLFGLRQNGAYDGFLCD